MYARVWIVTGICFSVVAAAAYKAIVQPTFHPPLPTYEQQLAAQDTHWASLPWAGDDAPYAKMRARIDAAIARGEPADMLRVHYGILAQKKPMDPLAQFAWAYAAEQTITPETSFEDQYNDLLGVPEALRRVRDPRTYNFERVRFIAGGNMPELRDVGERLLAKNAHDTAVAESLVGVYDAILVVGHSATASAAAERRAVELSTELARKNPRSPAYVAGVGAVYFYSWQRFHDTSDRNLARTWLSRYLSIKSSDDFRLFAREFLRELAIGPR